MAKRDEFLLTKKDLQNTELINFLQRADEIRNENAMQVHHE
jgi:hypothetical protein